jgi:hypothetical protein
VFEDAWSSGAFEQNYQILMLPLRALLCVARDVFSAPSDCSVRPGPRSVCPGPCSTRLGPCSARPVPCPVRSGSCSMYPGRCFTRPGICSMRPGLCSETPCTQPEFGFSIAFEKDAQRICLKQLSRQHFAVLRLARFLSLHACTCMGSHLF